MELRIKNYELRIPPKIQETQAATYSETYATAGNFTWTAPPGVTSVTVEAWGGGGAGGQRSTTGCGGGGGGGAYVSSTVSVTAGTAYGVTVGSAGVSAGANGGNSIFATTTVVAAGGATVPVNTTTGGLGGTVAGSTGTTIYIGGTGFTCISTGGGGGGSGGTGSNGNSANSSTGATAVAGGGPGGNGALTSNVGSAPASGPGGGGGGAYRTSGTKAGGAGYAGQIKLTYTVYTILGNGASEPSNTTIGPGGLITDLDNFTLQNTTSTDTVTALVVTLGPVNAYNNIAQVDITDTSNTAKCTAVTGLTSNTITFSTCTIPVTTTLTTYKVRITPKSAANMPPPPGASYDTTGTVTSFTSTNVQSGSDTGSATITIDNASPNGATVTSGSAGNAQVTLNWTTSNSNDFSRSVVFRWTGASAGSEVPSKGVDYIVGDATGTATIVCVRTTDASSTAVSGTDGAGTGGCSAVALTNGQAYTYKVFQKDFYGNYDVGVSIGTFTPISSGTVSCSSNITSTDFGTLTSVSISTASPNASTTMSCTYAAGCTLYIKDAGSGSQAGLYKSTSPTYTIVSATVTLSTGSDGYGLQAATSTAGSGTLNLNSIYYKTGNDVGGLSLIDVVLASSTAAITNREVIITHKAAITSTATAGSYSDTITYSCVGN